MNSRIRLDQLRESATACTPQKPMCRRVMVASAALAVALIFLSGMHRNRVEHMHSCCRKAAVSCESLASTMSRYPWTQVTLLCGPPCQTPACVWHATNFTPS